MSTIPEPRLAATPITWGYVGGGRWGVDLPQERILGEMADLGFRATETGVPGFLPDDPNEARELLSQFDMQVVSGPVSFVVHEDGGREEWRTRVTVASERLAALGADVLITVPKRGNLGPDDELSVQGWDRLVEGLSEAGRIAADHGLLQALHPHVGSLVETAADMLTLADRSDVGWCLDTAHVASGGLTAAEFVDAVGSRVNLVHLKDLDVELGRRMVAHTVGFDDAIARRVFRPLGEGDLDLDLTMAVLPRDVWWVLEQDQALPAVPDPGQGPVLDAAVSLDVYRRLTGQP